ncbi:MAG: hypothetical protein M1822_001894 [Bathelium mastoideum]|nr:MAG: hypothetical protein M1822_001894 [Bathelium mastoideum]
MPGRLLRWEFGHSDHHEDSTQHPSSTKTSSRRRRSAELLADKRRSSSSMEHITNIMKKHGVDKKDKDKDNIRPGSPKSLRMDFQMESPPILFLGRPSETASGFLMSGQLKVSVVSNQAIVNKLDVELRSSCAYKRPVSDRCSDCNTTKTSLRTWNILTEPRTLSHGEQLFPFSTVLPGHLPATTRGSLAQLTYHLVATAHLSSGELATHTRELEMKRALAPHREPKHCKRVFPPTTLVTDAYFPPVIHPIGAFPIDFRLSGIVTHNRDGSVTRNRLRRLLWSIEEHEECISPACARHADRVGGPGKGRTHNHTHIIGAGELASGWKTDFTVSIPPPNTANSPTGTEPLLGATELETQAAIRTNARPLCDIASPAGFTVRHDLIIELVIDDDWLPSRGAVATGAGTPTGGARVLKMTYALTVTERAGLGIGWDEEQPPVYEDVPPSPPHYAGVETYEGPWPLEEGFSLGPPEGDPPEEAGQLERGESSAAGAARHASVSEEARPTVGH